MSDLSDRKSISEDIIKIIEGASLFQRGCKRNCRLVPGNPGKALALAEDESFQYLRKSLIKGMSLAGSVKILDLYAIFADYRDRVEDLFNILQLWIRDLLILKETGEWSLIVNQDQSALLKRQVSSFTSAALRDMIENIEASRTMLKRNSNYQLTIENMLLSFQGGS